MAPTERRRRVAMEITLKITACVLLSVAPIKGRTQKQRLAALWQQETMNVNETALIKAQVKVTAAFMWMCVRLSV